MCGRPSTEVSLEVDHVIPLDSGGTDELSNLATLCKDCNIGKSAFQFADYRDVRVVPNDLASRFIYFHDDKTGDFERFHLYCYFQRGTEPGGQRESFEHSWTVSGTQWDTSSQQGALEQRRRAEESESFAQRIRRQLISDGKRLVVTEEGLCLV